MPSKPACTRPPPGRETAAPVAAAAAAAPETGAADTPARLIDARIAQLGDWRGERLGQLRKLICGADPGVVEEWKWDVPVWSCDGILCTGETYRAVVKLTFAKGAALPDPSRLFNSSLDGKVRRAIDFRQNDDPDADALQALIRAAAALNRAASRGRRG